MRWPMRILFTGTGDIGLPVLHSLLQSPRHEVCAVICQPDKPVGRKQILTPPRTKTMALAHGIPVHQPVRIRQAQELIAGLGADVMVVIAYGQILPAAILELPRLGCLNLHASLLPLYRGAAPIQAAILAGDAESGITVMYMDPGLDTGDILLMDRLSIAPGDTGGSLHDGLAQLAPSSLEKALDLLGDGTAPRCPQDHARATHIGKLGRSEGLLNWCESATALDRRIRAFDPWPGTHTIMPGGTILKVFPPVTVLPGEGGLAHPGAVLNCGPEGIRVACGEGSLLLHELQAEGRKRLPAAAFVAGKSLPAGATLGTYSKSL